MALAPTEKKVLDILRAYRADRCLCCEGRATNLHAWTAAHARFGEVLSELDKLKEVEAKGRQS